jgi:hypothetical protein
MNKKVELAVAELMKLPHEEQEIAAEAILDFASAARGLELSDEQLAEVQRRLAEPDPKSLTISEVRTRLRKLP